MKRSGQSLVEVLVSLSILTVGFVGILTLLAQSIFLSKVTSTQTTAAYLAAEGIEVAKNLIDHDVYLHLAGTGTGWGTCFGGGGDFEVDYTTQLCAGLHPYSSADFLEYNPTIHRYLYAFDDTSGGGSATNFTRRIRVVVGGGVPEITVDSIVTWNAGAAPQSVTLEDHFYNWHP